MYDIQIPISTGKVAIVLGWYFSDKISSLKDRLTEVSITKNDEVVGLCTEIVEYYKFVENNNLVLSERSKNHES